MHLDFLLSGLLSLNWLFGSPKRFCVQDADISCTTAAVITAGFYMKSYFGYSLITLKYWPSIFLFWSVSHWASWNQLPNIIISDILTWSMSCSSQTLRSILERPSLLFINHRMRVIIWRSFSNSIHRLILLSFIQL